MMGGCRKCGAHGYVMPLHGDRGGPPFCFMCAGAWHAEHGRLRRAARVVIKALKAYEAVGGKLYGHDFERLKLVAGGLGYIFGEADTAGADFSDLTSELLAATIALTHPDKHPPERKAEANRVTQELNALKPFVFPAPEPEPPPKPKPRDAYSNQPRVDLKEPSPPQPAYPCEDCRDAIPLHYCNPCKAEWEKRQQKEREFEEKKRQRKNDRQRAGYKWRRDYYAQRAKPVACATCGKELKPKRTDARYCSAGCRQRAYVKRDGKPSNYQPLGREQIEALIQSAFTAEPDNAFTADDLCARVFGKRRERKYRAAVIPAAKKVCERLGENWVWWRPAWGSRGSPVVFWNRASLVSYAMRRLKSDRWRHRSEEDLRAMIAPGGLYHEEVVEGGRWWQDRQEDIAKFKNLTAKQNNAGADLTNRHAEAAQ